MDNNKVHVIFTKGLIASGKSTWAKQFVKDNQNYKRVSRDDLRHMLSSYSFDDKNESIVSITEKQIILKLLEEGCNIIIDAQHLNEKYITDWKRFIKMAEPNLNIEFEIKEFPITLGEAIERDKKRDFVIGEKVIKQTWKRYEIELKQMLERAKSRYKIDGNLPYAIICDIDGTLSNSSQRRIFDFKECINDEVIEPVKYILGIIRKANVNKCVIILSGREEICRKETEEWLKIHDIKYDYLYMRKEKDYRDDTIIKKEIYEEHIKDKYNINFVIDDRPSVVQMWIDMGLFVFNVNQDPYCKNDF
jgi:predicted kinase